MSCKNLFRVIMTCSTAALLLASPRGSRADCPLVDWLFGNGRTTYAPPYVAPTVYAPAAGCGCAPAPCASCQSGCQTCTPTTRYRIDYRPVATVTYMPVVAVDPCSGCAVTSYRPTQAWTYQATLAPAVTYQAGYAPVAVGSCSSCGCSPCSGYSTSYSGCSSCGASCGCSSCGTGYGGCSSCNAGVSSTYSAPSGCSSCSAGAAPLYGAPLSAGGSAIPSPPASAPVTIGAPMTAPSLSGSNSETPRTFRRDATGAPGASGAPSTPGPSPATNTSGGVSPAGTTYRGPTSVEDSHATEPLRIEVPNGPNLRPVPDAHPEKEDRVTSLPMLQATYFRLLPSPPPSVPAQLVSTPASNAKY